MSDPGEVNQTGGKSRVFFALWPDRDVRARLHLETQRLHRLLGGRPTHPDSLHLTLVFVGDVDNGRLPGLANAGARVKCPPFEMAFDRQACWRHNHIAHLGVARPPEALFELVEQLSYNLGTAGITFDVRPYKPHITLIRKADCARFPSRGDEHSNVSASESVGDNPNENPALQPIRWSARDFVLVRSSLRPGGARYEQLGRWPLL